MFKFKAPKSLAMIVLLVIVATGGSAMATPLGQHKSAMSIHHSIALKDTLNFLGAYEFLPNTPILDFLGNAFCGPKNSGLQGLCSNVVF
ncbi:MULTISPECIES: hypothetical protein [unclassified Pseudomonas]|jgi:hypothetical protein|uniref:hypothetical protein n=1 Tax=unclassified Pseudomonas TaxID=196821 RepID=UPI0008D1DD36|nr:MULTISPECIES: hypothetical protein [unclassified Pseudomonas]PMV18941.1 hypothetical protein C1X17_24530 [Pseudomonas sp. FW305-3-2-15-C-TSA2]PMV26869.1 hypothetical protein C1X22_17725 [Pseudomonas sp. DP16D-L5]PMV38537.1 hypothetical protein C1X21_14300 [Pseudomonas sp. FW305-3-2-15-A-LB2]PMV43747.1 hypothetical protein C1X16_18895 [Pseudomonas sp. FW305-3-2-15-C-R2A1]PMV50147.1 hypothetical protein C1X18_16995 [Pseudomonas sp. FW305-3-2-15-C-LB1]